MMMLKIFLAKCWRLANGFWRFPAFSCLLVHFFTSSLVDFLNRIHKTLLYFIEDYGSDDEDERNENTAPNHTHQLKTSGAQKGIAETLENG